MDIKFSDTQARTVGNFMIVLAAMFTYNLIHGEVKDLSWVDFAKYKDVWIGVAQHWGALGLFGGGMALHTKHRRKSRKQHKVTLTDDRRLDRRR